MSERLDYTMVVRVSEELHEVLEVDARKFGRTRAQSVRFYLNQALRPNQTKETP